MNFNESKTKQNLARSFAAECQAGARYQFMATQAQMDKMFYIKDTLKMIAKNEMAHAKLFYDYILENCGEKCVVDFDADYPYVCPALEKSLKAEAEIELEEFETLYPEFAKIAKEEGFKEIAESFEVVAAVEKTHAEMLDKLQKEYAKGNLYKSKTERLFRCSNCGHLEKGKEGWKKCPLCSLEQGYIQIDFNEVFENCLQN
ncbi:MAG: rubrerythrin family protein [Clostridia bacterium]|nr:rubrerythrin family protein [Clostridia bacterium]